MKETVATVEELSDLWKPGLMDGIPPFVMIVIVFNCSYLLHLFDFHCLLVQYLMFLGKFTFFLFHFLDVFE